MQESRRSATERRKVRVTGLVPTAPCATPSDIAATYKGTANCVPISRAKMRFAATTRASISTCCDLRSSWRRRLSITGKVPGMSRMIKVLERSSAMMSPREERNFFSVMAISWPWRSSGRVWW